VADGQRKKKKKRKFEGRSFVERKVTGFVGKDDRVL
jgi:hypothetical protein